MNIIKNRKLRWNRVIPILLGIAILISAPFLINFISTIFTNQKISKNNMINELPSELIKTKTIYAKPNIITNKDDFIITASEEERIELKVSKKDIPFTNLKIDFNNKIKDAGIEVKVNVEPEVIYEEKGDVVYKYLEVDHPEISNDEIKQAVIEFKVPLEVLKNNQGRSVVLKRFHDDKWQTLDTIQTNSDGKYAYFESITPGFSYYTIVLTQYLQRSQYDSSVVMSHEDNRIYSTYSSYGDDGSEFGPAIRNLNLTGNTYNIELTPNTVWFYDQTNPQVERFWYNTQSHYAVAYVWDSYYGFGEYNKFDIIAKPYNSTLSSLISDECRINYYNDSNQTNPAIASNDNETMVVVWQSNHNGNYDIFAQKFSASELISCPDSTQSSSIKQTADIQINTNTTNNQISPDVDMDKDENFVVVWESDDDNKIHLQKFDNTLSKVGNEEKISSSSNKQINPKIDMNLNGDFVITWTEESSSQTDIFYKYYYANMTVKKQATEVDTGSCTQTNNQTISDVGIDSDGNFIITWDDYGCDGDGWGVYANKYGSDLAKSPDSFRVSDSTTFDQEDPAIDIFNLTEYVITWTLNNRTQYNKDMSGTDTYKDTLATTYYEDKTNMPNHLPIITSTPITTANENVLYNYDVDATDADSDTLTYSLILKPTDMSIGSSDGLISWTPNSTFIGANNISVQVSDGKATVVQNFTIDVTCDDSDSDGLCDSDEPSGCVGQSDSNLPANQTCTTYTFNSSGCHEPDYKANNYLINQTNCDSFDTVCTDYLSVNNTCDGAGNINMGTCNIFTDEPISTQCGTDSVLFGCYAGSSWDDDIYEILMDQHCDGAGNCIEESTTWQVNTSCDSNHYCFGPDNSTDLDDYSCSGGLDCSITDTLVADSSFADEAEIWDGVNDYCWNLSNDNIWVRTTTDAKFLGNWTAEIPAIIVQGYDNVKIQHLEFYDWDIGILLIDAQNITLDALYFENNNIAIKMINSSVNMLSDIVINNTNDGVGFWLENMTSNFQTNAYSDTLGPNYCYGSCSTYNYTMEYNTYIKADYPFVFVEINDSYFDGDYYTVENNVVGVNFTRSNETYFRDFTYNSTVTPLYIDEYCDSDRIRYNVFGGSDIMADSEKKYPMDNNWCPYNTYIDGTIGPNCNSPPQEDDLIPDKNETEDIPFNWTEDLWIAFSDSDTLAPYIDFKIVSQNTSIATCGLHNGTLAQFTGIRYLNCTDLVQDACGVINVTINATDNDTFHALSTTGDFLINVSCVNDAPILTQKSPATTASEGIQYQYQFLATDVDSSTLTWYVNHTGMSIDATGLLTWTPNSTESGNTTVKITVSDSELNDSHTWTIDTSCTDTDNDNVCDSADSCIGENEINLPSDTQCTYYTFNTGTGCHVTNYNTSRTITNTINCDSYDTVCTDYNTVYDTCDGAGGITTATCGDNITHQSAGYVINQTDCDTLDSTCRNYHDINNTCDGLGNVTFGTCNIYSDEPVSTQCGSDYNLYSCFAGNDLDDDVYNLLVDQHCDGAGSCIDDLSSWNVLTDCSATEHCSGSGNSTISANYYCSNCTDTDTDGICDTNDNCIGENLANLPSDTDCTTFSFNTTDGCHITSHKTSGTIVATINCDSYDTICTDYNTVYDTCDGAGNTNSASCGDDIIYQPNGLVINQTNCDNLDTECRNYQDVNNTCDGTGGINFGTCTSYTDEPISTQCGTDYYYYSCYAGNNLDDDVYNLLVDQHCDNAGNCIDDLGSWTVDTSCSASEQCTGIGNSTNPADYSCSNCADTDSDGVCDSTDSCIGENQANLPADTDCTTYSFGTDGCHVTDHKSTGTIINTIVCDSYDTACSDYNDVYDTCDGAGTLNTATCGDDITHQSNGFVINQTNCDNLDTTCRNYNNVDNTCDGTGGINWGSCNSYTDASTSTQCGTETCQADTCVGENWYDYPASVNRFCDGSGGCDTATCSATTSYSATCDPDDDDDGVDDTNDQCASTPNGEGVNTNGCSCSQVTIDDGNYCTDDSCINGVITYTNNNRPSLTITDCPEDYCNGKNWYDYPADDYAQCSGGTMGTYSCNILTNSYNKIKCDYDIEIIRAYIDDFDAPVAGGESWIAFYARNNGANKLSNIPFNIDLDGNTKSGSISNLNIGQKKEIWIDVVYPVSGSILTTISIDPNDNQYEFDETNNQYSFNANIG